MVWSFSGKSLPLLRSNNSGVEDMGKKSRRRARRRQLMSMQATTTNTSSIIIPQAAPKFQLARQIKVDYPEIYFEVFIAGDQWEHRMFADMFSRARCTKAKSPQEADLVIFTGGPDVSPDLYGEKPHPSTKTDQKRDCEDMVLYDLCITEGIPMFGVCRGAQFLHVMNGGKLYQDVDGHMGDHSIYCQDEKKVITKVSSVHHQMCIKNDEMKVLADSSKAKHRALNPDENVDGTFCDVEAFFYRSTCSLGVQGHPEYRGFDEYTAWCLTKIKEYIVENPDCTRKGRFLRWNPEINLLRETLKEKV